MLFSRRTLLASIGVAIPGAALTAAAEAKTSGTGTPGSTTKKKGSGKHAHSGKPSHRRTAAAKKPPAAG